MYTTVSYFAIKSFTIKCIQMFMDFFSKKVTADSSHCIYRNYLCFDS